MSDQDAAPDPMDKAYVEAEAMLDDEAARAARRARVLAAVAGEARAPAPAVSPPERRLAWPRARWLAAACVGGLGVLVAVRIHPPVESRLQPPPPAVSPPAATITATPAPAPVALPPLAAPSPPAPAPAPATATARAVPQAAKAQAPPEPPPPPPAQSEAAAPVASAEPQASGASDQVVATATRRAAPGQALAARTQELPSDAEQLRAAAATGRVAELTALLKRKTAVDAADENGETALMKAVQQEQPAAAALLRRHGANPDRKNNAGLSARDMARLIDDPELDKALGLSR